MKHAGKRSVRECMLPALLNLAVIGEPSREQESGVKALVMSQFEICCVSKHYFKKIRC